MSQGYIPQNGNHNTPPAAQHTESRSVNAGKYDPLERKNGTHDFAIVLALLSVLARMVAGTSLGVRGFNWDIAIIVALSGLYTSAFFFAAGAIIERQNKIIELLKDFHR